MIIYTSYYNKGETANTYNIMVILGGDRRGQVAKPAKLTFSATTISAAILQYNMFTVLSLFIVYSSRLAV